MCEIEGKYEQPKWIELKEINNLWSIPKCDM